MRGIDTFLALKEQADLFTPASLESLTEGDFLAFNSESLSGRQAIIDNPAIRNLAMRAAAFSAVGTMAADGTIEFTASNYTLNKLLGLLFHTKSGDADDPSGDGATYELEAGASLTPFTVFLGFDGPEGSYIRRYTGAKIASASISARVDDMLRVNVNIAAINKEIIPYGSVNPTYPAGDEEYAYVYDMASVLLKAGDMTDLVEIPVESFDLNINHNINTGLYRLGSPYRRSLQEGQTEVDGTFTLDAATKGINGANLSLTGGGSHDPAFLERVAREALFAHIRLQLVNPKVTVKAGAAATGTITITNNGNISEGDKVTVGSTVLTFVEADPEAGEVEIGASAGDTRDNLLAALSGATGVVVEADGADAITVTAASEGEAGNEIVLTTDSDGVAVSGSGTLSGGVNPVYATLVIDLPYCRLEEPDFNVRDGGILTGTARFSAYDTFSVTHKATFA